ncbi:phosphoglucosamine mutase [Methanocella arvoryzae]|uniref:Phosphoglucomutase/phosphomannomutase n=1 Tax=Methanocella arvoryzae (strain DSM 22066 / NBRC 105507 / MRE50) TaxID=351160 RepID=Q0W296_METAR|nr:phosphoglucosamine mutase [Methanocella arvoryzae]CAJ37497.1 phosphoglucomutase/phosphomannomutase [Methanocella arvoryzae MRE50]
MALFGTNGVRGIANVEMTPEMAMNLAKSIGTLKGGKIAVGRDTRQSGEMLKSAVIAGLLSTGCSVVDLGIAPTPTVQYYVKHHADAGIIITASHNPPEYNGVKGVAGDGTEMSRADEAEVEKIYFSGSYRQANWSQTGELSSFDPKPMYIDGIIKAVDAEAIRKKNFKVVSDTGCGAASLTTPFLLRKLNCKVISLNAQVDGTFPGRNPEPTGNEINDLKAAVVAAGADMGIAHDADADRAVFVDDKGRFVNEDVLLAMMTEYKLQRKPGTIVTPVSSSSLIEDIAKKYGQEVIWTQVGSIHVARKMMQVGAVFGGEGNGGLIYPEFQYCRDGGMSAASVLEMLATTGKKLSEIVDAVPCYNSVKEKIHCKNKNEVLKMIATHAKGDKIDTTDGVKIFNNDGWVLVRASGTEPIIRVFAESKTCDGAKRLAEYGVSLVTEYNK